MSELNPYKQQASKSIQELIQEITLLKLRIADLESQLRWIPESERPPEPLGWVIGMDNRREVYPCVYEDGQWLNDVQDELPTGCKITHWRPLYPKHRRR